MTEFKASLAPRRKINSSFLPFVPMQHSASACFMNPGRFMSEASPKPAPPRSERRTKSRREMTLTYGINLLFLKTVKVHQHRRHAPHSQIVGAPSGVARRQRAERRGTATVICGVEPID